MDWRRKLEFWQCPVAVDDELPASVKSALHEAEQAAGDADDILPLVECGDVVIIPRAQFADWFGPVEPARDVRRLAASILAQKARDKNE